MHPNDLNLKKLVEPYPTSGCSGQGTLVDLTQTHYECLSDFYENGEYFRVSENDFHVLSSYPEDFVC